METLTNNKPKIIATLVILIIAIVMLVTASVAWFSISTNPEITGMQVGIHAPDRLLLSVDNENWTENIDISEQFKYYAPLKPVSTVDGLHWFLPRYNEDGSLKPVNEFELDDNLTYANVMLYSTPDAGEEPVKYTGKELFEKMNQGYYVYGDFYLKTEEDETEVRLSYPNPFAYENTDILDTDGTYLLPSYELDNKTNTLKNISYNAERSARIGLLINPDYTAPDFKNNPSYGLNGSNEYKKNTYVIYEPNADLRTKNEKPATDPDNTTERYIIDYDFSGSDNFTDNNYYETLPIKKNSDGSFAQVRINSVPTTILVPQMHSQWNLNKLKESVDSYLDGESSSWWSSKDVVYPFGAFLNAQSLYNGRSAGGNSYPALVPKTQFIKSDGTELPGLGTGDPLNLGEQNGIYPYQSEPAYADSQVLIKLKKDEPVMIRMFVYIEGQDIDCWNDIAAGGFVVNIELGGYSKDTI